MTPDVLAEAVGALLPPGQSVVGSWATDGGMNSVTVGLTLPAGRVVAKWVAADEAAALRRGASVATDLAARGFRSGPPLTLVGARITAPLAGGEVAVLTEVPGAPLTAAATDQSGLGRTLALVHTLLPSPAVPTEEFLRHVGLQGDDGEELPDWVRRAAGAAADTVRRHSDAPAAHLHTDPAPEAFRRDDDGVVGLIDWSGSTPGPALYDVASAVLYAGGIARATSLVGAYAETVPPALVPHETGIRDFLRVRAAAQAAYFARRLARDDRTGIASAEENLEGLRDARLLLGGLES